MNKDIREEPTSRIAWRNPKSNNKYNRLSRTLPKPTLINI